MTEQETIKELRKENSMLRNNLGEVSQIALATMRAANMPATDDPGFLTMKDLPKFVGALRTERDRLFKKCGKPARG